MTVQRVILVRSGETDWNAAHRWQGWVEVPLNQTGILQAERLAQFIRNIGAQAVYASDLRRAQQTASIIADVLELDVKQDKRFRERDMGKWQGLTRTEMRNWYPSQFKELMANPPGYQIPGGESRREMEKRVRAGFDDAIDSDHELIVIVSHSSAIRGLLETIKEDFKYYQHNISNISTTMLHRTAEDKWEIVTLNDVTHLEGMPTRVIGDFEV